MPGETANNILENDGSENVRMTVNRIYLLFWSIMVAFFFSIFTIVIFAFLLLLYLLVTALVEVKDPLAELFLFIISSHI